MALAAFPNFKSAAIFMFSYTVKSSWSLSSCVMYEVDFLNSSANTKWHKWIIFMQRWRWNVTGNCQSGWRLMMFTHSNLWLCHSRTLRRSHLSACSQRVRWARSTFPRRSGPWWRSDSRSGMCHWPCGEFLSSLRKEHLADKNFIINLFSIRKKKQK